MPNFRMLLSYDGARYQGWQRQGNTKNTIQGKLEETLSRILETPVELHGSGRTDAGAHALGQTASFRAETDLPPQAILRALRRYLPEDIGVLALEYAPPRFHARLSAVGKTYRYRVWNSERPNVLERRYLYTVPAALDLGAMERAAADLLGTHDFRSFCANPRLKKSSVRTIQALDIRRLGDEVRFTVTGDGFLYNMVRIVVGTLLEVGLRRREAGCIPEILAARSRAAAGETAPARGLCLMEVYYP
ncbi:MAG: tRNA pseudouridine(38-40) synthase TruA [Oscillospiraceae bacterium]|nr:tRNA pseudouridine(38-40) synthase TruA [Oscillospiraceae bacterium]